MVSGLAGPVLAPMVVPAAVDPVALAPKRFGGVVAAGVYFLRADFAAVPVTSLVVTFTSFFPSIFRLFVPCSIKFSLARLVCCLLVS